MSIDHKAKESYGIAVDLGTSSIWLRLVELPGKRALETLVVPNPQKEHGADIASRLGKAAEDEGVRASLHNQAIEAVGSSAAELCRRAGVDPGRVRELVVVGNSAMFAFLLDLDPSPLCGTPFNLRGAEDFYGPAADLGIALGDANLFVPRPIFGFVGADALADILLVDMAASERPRLVIDVGTNCEMTLGGRGKIWVASSPAGPAYEDTHMSFGVSAS